jgi:uncharacterized protein (TIGR02246 family)
VSLCSCDGRRSTRRGYKEAVVKQHLAALALITAWAISPLASAGDKEDVSAATASWADAFSRDTPDQILAMYDKEAVLWGTSSPTLRNGPEQIRAYFVSAFERLRDRKVTVGDQLIRVYNDIAINTGYYTFRYTLNGEPKESPARFSFVFRKRNGRWLIVDHHSSAMPPTPK